MQGTVGNDNTVATDYLFNTKGDPLKGIPETKYTLRATYEMDSPFGPLWWVLNHSYTGDFSASGIDRAYDRVPERDVTNLSASWWSDDNKTSVRFAVNNITDEEDIRALETTDSSHSYAIFGTPLPPRTYYVDVRYSF